MDLKNLLGPSTSTKEQHNVQVADDTTLKESKPELRKRYSSINDLVNNDESSLTIGSSSPIANSMKSPALIPRIPSSSNINTPNPIAGLKARTSISNLTNDNDVDVDGKETPSIARRLSYEANTASESNSPILPKKSIPRPQPNILNESQEDKTIKFEEFKYNSKDRSKTEDDPKSIRSSPKTKAKDDPVTTAQSSTTGSTTTTPLKQTNGAPRGKSKPKRYAKPPIWATKWVPPFQKQNTINNNQPSKDSASSITGVKPYNDLTRKITEWMYAQILRIPLEERQFLELEIKFGRIWEKRTDRRINIPVTNEAIIDDSYMMGCSFKSGLEKEHYDRIKKYLVGLTKLDDKSFRSFKFDQVDKQYREALRDQIPKSYRLTFDKSTNRIVANIEKRKIANLHIHSPDQIFDYRITMSLELPSNQNPERFDNQTPEIERTKKRLSIIHDLTSTKFDLTDVVQKQKTSKNQAINSLEVELELNIPKLLDAYDRLDQDSFTFEEMGERIMDNARILNRKLKQPDR